MDVEIQLQELTKNQNQQQLQQQKLQHEQTQSSYFDKLYRANAPNFEGGPDPDVALNWIAQMETKFKALRFPEDVNIQEEFKEMFLDQYFPRALRKKRQNDFYSLRRIGNMTVFQYANKFASLGCFCPRVFEDEEEKMDRFEQGLREEIGCQLASHNFTTFKNMYDAALAVEMQFKLNEGERNIGKKPRWMMGFNRAAGTRQQGNLVFPQRLLSSSFSFLAKVWGFPKNLVVIELEANLFMFNFGIEDDLTRVLSSRPWIIDNQLLALQRWEATIEFISSELKPKILISEKNQRVGNTDIGVQDLYTSSSGDHVGSNLKVKASSLFKKIHAITPKR
ncbi:hypothetical protein ACH5RR_000883 [Cinchona calisaya]|uniref:Retrotransposon gag domain-containing protein n=1 Tax=Cinchona calisaya TaxID=153742 RepID=A0ABD3B1V1_9GENT